MRKAKAEAKSEEKRGKQFVILIGSAIEVWAKQRNIE